MEMMVMESRKRPRTMQEANNSLAELNSPNIGQPIMPLENGFTVPHHSTVSATPVFEHQAAHCNSEPSPIRNKASIDAVATMFPQVLIRAMSRERGFADIELIYLEDQMSAILKIVIAPHNTQSLAHRLFGVNIEIEDSCHYMAVSDVVRVTPTPFLKVQGATESTIIEYLGERIHHAIEKSDLRKQEKENGIKSSCCLSFDIPLSSLDRSYLYVTIDTEQGHSIRADLRLF
ncbi:hypothetical protein BU24DRAFT_448619 [Aaosphaeria arxii CBS 175.79]|uniref:Uncharacterized protein n=1 Tax=Aaosphaeria arxii CBS 175.79 TaxID=1450172 RepID=A0A6A5Y545_9PLEO|nr:uncharacterized protein BU24DRAFT_448619 [Aaosphaeria arxii CBS 175.79]KAF2020333.1 hypothetical protein BU24DRAFT_448619 [Aaosphaeria arxii CBS 175.79]